MQCPSRLIGWGCLILTALAGWPLYARSAPAADPGGPGEAAVMVEPGPDASARRFSTEASFDFPSAYVFRGYTIHDAGVQAQSSLGISTDLRRGGLSVTPSLGLWTNLTSEAFGASRWKHWDELDFTGGLTFAYLGTSCEFEYCAYSSPSRFSGQVTELGVTLSQETDDGPKWLTLLSPHLSAFRELINKETLNPGTYFEAGVEPRLRLAVAARAATVSFPLTWGSGRDGYYSRADGSDCLGGYAVGGVRANYPLLAGTDIHGEVDLYDLISDSVRAANRGRSRLLTAAVGLGFSF